MNNIFDFFNAGFKMWIVVLTALALDNPDWIGHWMAQKDIAYDSIWSEYVADCDCTESLE